MLFGSGDKGAEQGMGLVGTALQLRVELYAYKPGVIGQLHDLHQPSVRGQARKAKPGVAE